MQKLLSFLKTGGGIILILVFGLLIGFFTGMQYKSYQMQRNLEKFQENIDKIFTEEDSNENQISETNQNNKFNEANILDNEKKNKYIEKIDIIVEVNEYKSILNSENRFNGKTRSLKGKIKNNSDQSFNKARLFVIFLDENDQPIYEDDYNPLYNSDKMESIILKPNYTNEFNFNTDGVPNEWSGKIKYQINDIE